jgi:cyclophilin family peptidyl-prolyl cis-trans isomerase/HEAT repeat protein
MRMNRQMKNRDKGSRSSLCTRAASVTVIIIFFFACALVFSFGNEARAQQNNSQRQPRATPAKPVPVKPVPDEVILRIMRAEDERRWDNDLGILLFDQDARVRERAALASGRIGDERAVASLITLLQTDREATVRAMAAFALGETESLAGAASLTDAAQKKEPGEVRARVLEALGKIVAALPKSEEARGAAPGAVILKALDDELKQSPKPRREVVLLGLTAVLRARPTGAGPIVARFLSSSDARVRADAANTLARLHSKDGLEKARELLSTDAEPTVRANAARVLGVAEDATSIDALAARAVNDTDERVRISSIRALGALKDARAAAPLLERADALLPAYRAAKAGGVEHPREMNELLEIATGLGRLLANTADERAVSWLRRLRETERAAPEVEIAFARIAPFLYLREAPLGKLADERLRVEMLRDWRRVSALAQALAEVAGVTAEAAGSGIVSLQADAQIILRSWIDDPELPPRAAPDVLRSLSAFKVNDLVAVLRKQMSAKDVIVRATAAELLGEFQPDEANARLLAEALPVAARDELNDAALSILDSLAKQKSTAANDAIKTMLDATDPLVRKRAAALLKANGAGDFSQRAAMGTATRNTAADYARALARANKTVRAVVNTDKGAFTIELLADEAPLNVDNFVQLAQRGYYDNVVFHRVVPNFVAQGGDPRGDGNGGPGYQIRCEINEVPYERGAVGMALSGKDTGGSQWFVTHSPQPHLDGGYTVFGRVVSGMEVVDKIARGDRIRGISVTESARDASKISTSPQAPSETKKKRTGKP